MQSIALKREAAAQHQKQLKKKIKYRSKIHSKNAMNAIKKKKRYCAEYAKHLKSTVSTEKKKKKKHPDKRRRGVVSYRDKRALASERDALGQQTIHTRRDNPCTYNKYNTYSSLTSSTYINSYT